MADTASEKTEEPSQRRLDEARKDGNVAKSQDLIAAVSLFAAIMLMKIFGLSFMSELELLTRRLLGESFAQNPTSTEGLSVMGLFALRQFFWAAFPISLGIMAVTLLVTMSQVGLFVTLKPLQPNFGKLNPLKGVKQFFDMRAAMRLFMSLGKLILIAGVSIFVISQRIVEITKLVEMEAVPLFFASCSLVYELAMTLSAILLAIAVIDYSYQKWQRTQDLRMTKQEVKEEMKNMDGDPMVKQRRQRIARQLAMQRISTDVPGADVIITNPTHYAIALKYDSKTMAAPRVVAKGADFLAMRIRQVGIANDIPLVERRELAQALYRTVEVGQELPGEYYAAVAEILAYVYRMSGGKQTA